MAAGGGSIPIKMKRLDGEQQQFELKLAKQTTVKAIKSRVEMELGIPPDEQLLLFRGQQLKKDSAQPLATPDLQEIIEEAGPEGLQMAVFFAKKRLPAFLKKEGFEEVNDKRRSGGTALHRATRKCELNVMEELLDMEEFSLVNGKDKAGQTALHTAAEAWFREACEILLRSPRFTAPGVSDKQGRTALHLAAHWGDLGVCELILGHWKFASQDVEAIDVNGCTAVEYARQCGHMEVADAIANSKCKPRVEEVEAESDQDDEEAEAGGPEGEAEREPEGEAAEKAKNTGEPETAAAAGEAGAAPDTAPDAAPDAAKTSGKAAG